MKSHCVLLREAIAEHSNKTIKNIHHSQALDDKFKQVMKCKAELKENIEKACDMTKWSKDVDKINYKKLETRSCTQQSRILPSGKTLVDQDKKL